MVHSAVLIMNINPFLKELIMGTGMETERGSVLPSTGGDPKTVHHHDHELFYSLFKMNSTVHAYIQVHSSNLS